MKPEFIYEKSNYFEDLSIFDCFYIDSPTNNSSDIFMKIPIVTVSYFVVRLKSEFKIYVSEKQ